jgi:NADH:ubiquinone oxidoreductase subunit 4 (subunit M)
LHRYAFICGTICLVGSIYSALIAIHQLDFKRVIAYSSVSHMSFCLLGFMSGKYFGVMGSILMSVGHGLISVALFLLIGLIYERTHTKLINVISGISEITPALSGFLFLSLIANFSFPITLNFISELLILVGIGS